MDPSSRQSQEMPNPSMLVTAKGNEQQERRPRPQPEQALKCPRCDSTNTKFCYYNNYSLSQPRYFCKSCRRYWTKGGTLRNVPVGGSCRKNRRSSSSKRTQDHTTLPPLSYGTDDLSLDFARLQKQANVNLGFDTNELSMLENPSGLAFIGNPNTFQGVYNYGSLGEVDNGSGTVTGVSTDMMTMLSYNDDNKEITSNAAITTTSDVTVKQNEDRSVLLDLPWQFGGDHGNYNMAELDSGTESWGGLGSSWHGLLNSSLM